MSTFSTIQLIKWAPILNHLYSNLQKIVAGAHNIAKDEDSSWQVRKISKLWPHEDYDSNEFTNDISLLKLSEPLVFNEFVQPIKLAESQEIVEGISKKRCTQFFRDIIIFVTASPINLQLDILQYFSWNTL